ncbi:MAG: GDSL-type esterase/lipase family protein [Propionibacteriaceae bacterium]
MHRTVRTFTLAGFVALVLAVSTAIPAQADPRLNSATYVALGDSYSSGALLGGNLDQTCDRSSAAYPVVLAGGTNFVTFKACSGATILDTLAALPIRPQPNVKVVTLTVGFNDTDWEAAVQALLAGQTVAALGLLADTASEIQVRVAQRVPVLIAALRTIYPKATIFWGGYVRQFGAGEMPGVPGVCTFAYGNPEAPSYGQLTNDFANGLDGLVTAMNGVLQGSIVAARSAGAPITYVETDSQFNHLRSCNNPAPAVFNLHPTSAGQLLYAKAFTAAGVVK